MNLQSEIIEKFFSGIKSELWEISPGIHTTINWSWKPFARLNVKTGGDSKRVRKIKTFVEECAKKGLPIEFAYGDGGESSRTVFISFSKGLTSEQLLELGKEKAPGSTALNAQKPAAKPEVKTTPVVVEQPGSQSGGPVHEKTGAGVSIDVAMVSFRNLLKKIAKGKDHWNTLKVFEEKRELKANFFHYDIDQASRTMDFLKKIGVPTENVSLGKNLATAIYATLPLVDYEAAFSEELRSFFPKVEKDETKVEKVEKQPEVEKVAEINQEPKPLSPHVSIVKMMVENLSDEDRAAFHELFVSPHIVPAPVIDLDAIKADSLTQARNELKQKAVSSYKNSGYVVVKEQDPYLVEGSKVSLKTISWENVL